MRRHVSGYAYVLALIAAATLTAVSLRALSSASMNERRDREAELLSAGMGVERAIGSYYLTSPGSLKELPRGWSDLLEDRRFARTTRHLRRIPLDPMTGLAEWGLVMDADGRMIGVHSLATARPVKRAGFPADHDSFQAADTYAQWRFVFHPG